MEKKVIKYLRIIGIICLIVLIVEILYIGFFMEKKSIYFDGVNSIIEVKSGFVSIGSNNDNDSFTERAKITKYNSKKVKVFEKLYNKGYNGAFFDVVQDNDESLIAVGSYEATKDEKNTGSRTALIVKYDKDGNILYDADFQLLGNSKYMSIEVVEDGYIVVGQSIYEDMVVGHSTGGGAYIAKYDKKLEVVWMNNFGDSKSAIYNDLVVVDKNIYVVGKTNTKGVISKYDMSGKIVETVYYDGVDELGLSGITYNDGKLYIVGGVVEELAATDGVVLKYNLDLVLKEKNIYNDKYIERFNQVVVDEDDNILVIGTSSVVDTRKDEINSYSHDGLLVKYDEDLKLIKALVYGDEKDDYFTGILVLDNEYLVIGYSSYEDESYLSKFITYSKALKVLEVL